MRKIYLLIFGLLSVALKDFTCGFISNVQDKDWLEYKRKYGKNYCTLSEERYAKYYYEYNKKIIENHNKRFKRGLVTYKLDVNQFTDMRLIHFNALFPVAIYTELPNDSPPPDVQTPSPSYNLITDFGIKSNVENQGIKCNSGWAYAAVKAIELLRTLQTGNIRPMSLSAQNVIDCAGRAAACKTQVPQAAFDYLTLHDMDLHFESNYNNNNNTLHEQGMCVPPQGFVPTVKLAHYSRLKDGDDESLKAYVSAGYPVVVEFNPTSFEFMHYSEGIFQQLINTRTGSHFMVVLGYGTDQTTGRDYWLLQNSFGNTWGESGFMKLYRSPTMKLIKNAIFPSELA